MKKRSLKFNDKAKDFLKSMCFLSPSLLGVGVFFIIPFFVVVYYSVIDGVGSRNFVFLDNFVKLFHNSAFLTAAKNTLTFSFLAVPLAVILSGEHWVDVMKPGVNKGCAMRGIQQKLGISYLFIAHDLLVVQHISKRIAVMYLGRIVETAESDEIINHPQHPYTQSLISAIPIPDPDIAKTRHRIPLEGDVPSPMNMPSGCPFRTRCRYATERCAKECPSLQETAPGHSIACWNPHY